MAALVQAAPVISAKDDLTSQLATLYNTLRSSNSDIDQAIYSHNRELLFRTVAAYHHSPSLQTGEPTGEAVSLFPKFQINKCLEMAERNMVGMLQCPEARGICAVFEQVGFQNAQVGYNPGLAMFSVSFKLPQWEKNPSYRHLTATAAQAVVYNMLGLHHHQYALEYDYLHMQQLISYHYKQGKPLAECPQLCDFGFLPPHADRRAAGPGGGAVAFYPSGYQSCSDYLELLLQFNDSSTLADDASDPHLFDSPYLLANSCLQIFSQQTQCMVTDIQYNYHQQECTIVLQPAVRGYRLIPQGRSGAPNPYSFLTGYIDVSLSAHQKACCAVAGAASDTACDTGCDNGDGAVRPTLASLALDNDHNVSSRPLNQADALQHADADHDVNPFFTPSLQSDQGVFGFYFSPIYPLIVGYNGATGRLSQTFQTKHVHDLITILTLKFWIYVNTIERYYPTNTLKLQVNQLLEKFFFTGLARLRSGFNPDVDLSLFLWGTAGTGKSTFVRVFCSAIHYIINAVFEVDKKVETTRIPLNQTSPAKLKSLLNVKGLSDWSIERIIEQTISRQGLCILHLEEFPPDLALQDELYSIIRKLCMTLSSRYPEHRHNIILMTTANYAPSPMLSRENSVIEITAVSQPTQLLWVRRTVEDLISSRLVVLHDFGQVAPSSDSVARAPTQVSTIDRPESFVSFRKVIEAAHRRAIQFETYPKKASSAQLYTNPYSSYRTNGFGRGGGSGSMPRAPTSLYTFHAVNHIRTVVKHDIASSAVRFFEQESMDVGSAISDSTFAHMGSITPHITTPEANCAYLQFRIKVNLLTPIRRTNDMRKLESWKKSVSYSILTYLFHHLPTISLLCGLLRSYPTMIPLGGRDSNISITAAAGVTANTPIPAHSQVVHSKTPLRTHQNPRSQRSHWFPSLFSWGHGPAAGSHAQSSLSSSSGVTSLTTGGGASEASPYSYLSYYDDPLLLMTPGMLLLLGLTANITQVHDPRSHTYKIFVHFFCHDETGFKRPATTSRVADFYRNPSLSFRNSHSTTEYHQLLPPLELSSSDGFFFHIAAPNPRLLKQPSAPGPSASTVVLTSLLSQPQLSRLHSIIAMWRTNFLQPAVVVAAGNREQNRQIVDYIHEYIYTMCEYQHIPTYKKGYRVLSRDPVEMNSNITYRDVQPIYNIEQAPPQQQQQQCEEGDSLDHHFATISSSSSPSSSSDSVNSNIPVIQRLRDPYPSVAPARLSGSESNPQNELKYHDLDSLVDPPIAFDAFRHLIGPRAEDEAPRDSPSPVVDIYSKLPSAVSTNQDGQRPPVFNFYALAHTDQHKFMLFGDPDPAASVLTRFITKVQTAHHPKQALAADTGAVPHQPLSQPALGVFFLSTNQQGQFYFRDLIDSGASSTHVTTTMKDRLLFILVLNDDDNHTADESSASSLEKQPSRVAVHHGDTSHVHNVQPQLISRSHLILDFSSSSPSSIPPPSKPYVPSKL